MERIKQLKNHLEQDTIRFIELIPESNDFYHNQKLDRNPILLQSFEWLRKKLYLNQDICIFSSPSMAAVRRSLIFMFANLTSREIEYVSLSRDTSEEDLVMRRELIDGKVLFTEGPATRACRHGRILVLDGIEKTERNVLPIINNLLENRFVEETTLISCRELVLPSGQFFINSKQFDSQSAEKIATSNLVRTSPDFLIVALGTPVPPYRGMQLDPPFRSRFQCRFLPPNLSLPSLSSLRKSILPLQNLYLTIQTQEGIPDFPPFSKFVPLLSNNWEVEDLLNLLYPFTEFEEAEENLTKSIFAIFAQLGIRKKDSGLLVVGGSRISKTEFEVHFSNHLKLAVKAGPPSSLSAIDFKESTQCLSSLLISHSISDFLLLGPKSSGKSHQIRLFSSILSYPSVVIPCHSSLTYRDLLQRRVTSRKSGWADSELVLAARKGHLLILEDVERLGDGVLSSLGRLVGFREVCLPDGSLLVSSDKYRKLESLLGKEELERRKIGLIHDCFRIVGVGRTGSIGWEEESSIFGLVVLKALTKKQELDILEQQVGNVKPAMMEVINIVWDLRDSTTLRDLGRCFTLKEMIRSAKRIEKFGDESVYSMVMVGVLGAFLPPLTRAELDLFLKKGHNVEKQKPQQNSSEIDVKVVEKDGIEYLSIGDVQEPIAINTDPLLIPNPLFYSNRRQSHILQSLLKSYVLGFHLLLIGPQGVGKNKLVDYLLHLMRLPREYMQLHRDTTVYSMTMRVETRNGQLVYLDSGLVRAIKEGLILVVDEADKAPTEVTAVLKGLAEGQGMILGDGRPIVSVSLGRKEEIIIHPNFRMIVLANKPGFPFLGNDFYREIGDAFATHCIDNPDRESELSMLKRYGPNVSHEVLEKLIDIFTELRNLAEKGDISYPYSTREIVNVVKHLNAFPKEGLGRALDNVFDFDQELEVRDLLKGVLDNNGVYMTEFGKESPFKVQLGIRSPVADPVHIQKFKMSTETQKIIGSDIAITLRGPYPTNMTHFEILEHFNGRGIVFSELLSTFRIFKSATPRDIILGTDNFMYCIGSSPASLAILSPPDYKKAEFIPLHEFIPAGRTSRLTLFEAGIGLIAIHNANEPSIVVVDVLKKSISVFGLQGLEGGIEISVARNNSHFGSVVVYQPSLFLIVDLSAQIQKIFKMEMKMKIMRVSYFECGWLIQDTSGGFHNVSLDGSTLLITKLISYYSFDTNTHFFSISRSGTSYLTSSPPIVSGGVLEKSFDQFYILGWIRVSFHNVQTSQCGFLTKSGHCISALRMDNAKSDVTILEILSPSSKSLLQLEIRLPFPKEETDSPLFIEVLELPDGNSFLLMDALGECRIFKFKNERDLLRWSELNGPNLSGEVSGEGGSESGEGEGGFGGGNSFGEGAGAPGNGLLLEGRESGKIDESFELRSAGDIPKITEAQRNLHNMRFLKKLSMLQMTDEDFKIFSGYKRNVTNEIRELRAILESIQAKNKERVWLKNQIAGEIDESRLIEGLIGEKTIYRKRADNPDLGWQQKKKQLFFVFDVSASMMRFNGHDGRMDRSIESALMLMEAFKGFEHKFQYSFFGHSGDGPAIELTKNNHYPKHEKDIFEVLMKMKSNAMYTISGDNTLNAITTAIENIVKEDADDYFVVLLSDANVHQYAMSGEQIAQALKGDNRVNAFIIFIGNVSQQADRLSKELPSQSFNCFDNKDLPKIIKSIFLKSLS